MSGQQHAPAVLYPPIPIVQEAEWAPGPVWTGGKSRPTGIRSPDRPARSSVAIPTELPGPLIDIYIYIYIYVCVCVCVCARACKIKLKKKNRRGNKASYKNVSPVGDDFQEKIPPLFMIYKYSRITLYEAGKDVEFED